MIFLSYNHKDKLIIDPIANSISKVVGKKKVFYDRWSIQPGDSFLQKMDEGLENCEIFFLFISKNSIQSNFVKLEWYNALIKATKGQSKIVPVKLDDVEIPSILLQTLYIDIFNYGVEVGTRHILEVVQGKSTYQKEFETYQNIRAYLSTYEDKISIEFRAETYSEPISKYMVILQNTENEINWKVTSDSMANIGFNKGIELSNGLNGNGLYLSVNRATTPAFPFKVDIISKSGDQIKLIAIMREIKAGEFKTIPLINK